MKDRKLAVRYARAILGAFPDPREAGAVDGFLTNLGAAIEGSAELRSMLLNPSVPKSIRTAALTALADRSGAGKPLARFLETIVDHGRVSAIPAIAETYHELREKAAGIVPVSIESARPMPQDLLQRAQVSLERLTGKRVRLTCTVDPTLLGGLITRIGSNVYDGSLRTQISGLRRRMVEE